MYVYTYGVPPINVCNPYVYRKSCFLLQGARNGPKARRDLGSPAGCMASQAERRRGAGKQVPRPVYVLGFRIYEALGY